MREDNSQSSPIDESKKKRELLYRATAMDSYRSPSVGGLIKIMNTNFYPTAVSNPPTKIFCREG